MEKLDLPFTAGAFDCIVCGDVIEHLRARIVPGAGAGLARAGWFAGRQLAQRPASQRGESAPGTIRAAFGGALASRELWLGDLVLIATCIYSAVW